MEPTLPQLLAELIRTPSINPMERTDIPTTLCGEHRVTAVLERHLQALPVRVERWNVAPGRDNLLAFYKPPRPSDVTILLEAHQDTVPVDGMTIDPFGAEVRDGRMFGRGACDVKAGGVALFGAFRRLAQQRPPASPNVILAYTVDEEHTFLGVQKLMANGLRADFAIVAEPTSLDIVHAHKGVARWWLEVDGVACHSSTPERGTSAIYRMAKVLSAVQEYAERLPHSKVDAMLGRPTLSVGFVQGGVSANTVPDACRAVLDRRTIPGETARSVMQELRDVLESRFDFPIRFVPTLDCPALCAEGGERFVTTLSQAIGSPQLLSVPYGTDASTLQEAGIPAVVFGPGDIAQAHTKDEWVELQQVEQAADMVHRFLMRAQSVFEPGV